MPLMFGVMGFFFPAGLTVYIFTNTCLSALHSIYMNKYDKKSLAIAAQLKKNQEAAKAGAADPKKNGKPASVAKPKPIIEATAVETSSDADDSDDTSSAAAEASPGTPGGVPRQRPRKKKRRR